MEKKQKLLIALLAIAGLGAGSFYYFTREPGSDAPVVLDGSTGRKERKKTDEAPKTAVRKETTARPVAAAEPAGRKERVERTEEASGRKTRTKGTETVKKKKLAPAA